MQRVFRDFAAMLNERLGAKVFTTEAAVRHTFFHALLKSEFSHKDVLFECPHPASAKSKIDVIVKSLKRMFVCEFKYDRMDKKNKHNKPRPMQAGSIFNDLFRLAQYPSSNREEKYFIYLTDHEMANYFRNPRNNLSDFFDLPRGDSLVVSKKYLNTRPMTFLKSLKSKQIDCTLICMTNLELQNNHFLRIYKVDSLRD